MSITRDQILTDEACYNVKTPKGSWTFETSVGEYRQRPAYYIWTYRGAKRQYVGALDDFTGQIEPTAKSMIFHNDYSVTVLNRILARIWADDHAAYTQAGFDINLTNPSPIKPVADHNWSDFSCQECGQKFRTTTSAERATRNGCPKCGGTDIDLSSPAEMPAKAPSKPAAASKSKKRPQLSLAELKAVMTPVDIAEATGGASLPDEADGDDDSDLFGCPPAEVQSNGTTSHNDTSMARVPGAASTRVNMVEGFFSVDDQERKAQQMQQMADNLSGDLWSFEYDIPDAKTDDVPNPSDWLWQYACRKTLSCWILTDKGLKAPTVQEYLALCKEHAITVDLIRYHPADQTKVRDRIRQRLAEHVQAVHTSLIERLASGAERLAQLTKAIDLIAAGDDPSAPAAGLDSKIVTVAHKLLEDESGSKDAKDKASRLNDNAARSLLKSIGEDLNHAIKCSEMFDETENLSSLFEAARSALAVEKQTFNDRMAKTGGKQIR